MMLLVHSVRRLARFLVVRRATLLLGELLGVQRLHRQRLRLLQVALLDEADRRSRHRHVLDVFDG